MIKRLSKPRNPFLYHGYAGPDYFCDREQETSKIISAITNGRNITLMSPRRIGKTGLIHNVFYRMHEQNPSMPCIYVDIFSTRNQQDFVNVFCQQVFEALKTPLDKIINIISQCRPVVGVDQFSGTPTLSFDVQAEQSEINIREIFAFLNNLGKECCIAIDEFQQITRYPQSGTEALLRSYIQFLPNVHFIFAGSVQHIMSEMFLSPQRPFFQSTQLLSLSPISMPAYYQFASSWFHRKGGSLAESAFAYAYNLVDGQTWYVQSILNRLYENFKDVAENAQIAYALSIIMDENEATYQGLLSMLTDNQEALLRAIAKEGIVKAPTAGKFLSKYHLFRASSVQTALESLLKNELVYKSQNGYIVYDRFLGFWLRRQ